MLEELSERDRALAEAALAQGVVGEGQLRQALSAPPPFAGALRRLAGNRAWQLDVIEQELGPAPTSPPAAARWEPGEVVEGFMIQRLLGEGGMGKVFLVEDVSGKAFALKTLAREADADLRGRFRREGEAQARVDGHPNVLRVRSSGEVAGEAFLVLDVAQGGDLSERLRDRPLEIGAVFELGVALAGAIQHAHEQGVLHRDLKPSNVLFDESGVAKVCDFGLAALQGAESLTQTGASLGTPSYMAPEQADSTRGEIGPATDVYGLGAVLFAALTGKPPFSGGRMRVVSALLLKEAPRARSLRKDAPPALDAVLEICLRKEPGARFPSARALQDALEDARRGVAPNRRNPGRRRRSLKKAALMVLLVTSLCAAAGAVAYALKGRRVEAPPVDDPRFEIQLDDPVALTYSKVFSLSGRVLGEGVEKVRVGTERPVRVDLEGRFRVRVRLAEGLNTLRVEALSPKAVQVAVLEHEVRFLHTPSWWRRLAESKRPPLPLPEGLTFGEGAETYTYKEGSTLVWVPPGSFTMGRPDDAFVKGVSPADQDGARKLKVTLTYGYFIGKYELTWGQYQAYCQINKIEVHERKLNFRLERRGSGYGFIKVHGEGVDFVPDEGYPVHGLSWIVADQYTRFYGLRLPTEPEWEYAARGTQVGNFPWGDQAPGPSLLNRFDLADDYPYTAPVDSFAAGASPFGCFHMAGNVREFTSSYYAPYPTKSVVDWKGGPRSDSYVSRGWGFANVDPEAYTVYRRWPVGILKPNVEHGLRVALSHPALGTD